jgi:hypothetical protein
LSHVSIAFPFLLKPNIPPDLTGYRRKVSGGVLISMIGTIIDGFAVSPV